MWEINCTLLDEPKLVGEILNHVRKLPIKYKSAFMLDFLLLVLSFDHKHNIKIYNKYRI